MKVSMSWLLPAFWLTGVTIAYPVHFYKSHNISGIAASVATQDIPTSGSTLALPTAAHSNVVNGGGKAGSVKLHQVNGDEFGGVLTATTSGETSQVKTASATLELANPPAPPISTPSPSVHEQAKAYGESIALWLLHHVLLVVVAFITIAVCWYFAHKWHQSEDAIALLSGTATTSVVYIIWSNTVHEFGIIQFGILFGYLMFHTRYCQLRAIGTGNTWAFVLGTTLITVVLFALVHMSVLSDLWKQHTGLPGIFLVLPIHLVVFELGAYERRGGQ